MNVFKLSLATFAFCLGVPKDGRLDELYRPLADWNNVPDTK
jgi:hypothetical protein